MQFVRKLHKWLGLVVGLQLALWTISGLVFAWLDHHQVSAEHSVREIKPRVLTSGGHISEPAGWLAREGLGQIFEIRLVPFLDQWVWHLETSDRRQLRNADGTLLVLDEHIVKRLALSHYAGDGALQSVIYSAEDHMEARGAGAVWQASFQDPQETTLYFAADDGRLVATRNAAWRIFDFFWMLHTMDYSGRDNFNNPLAITIGFAVLWLSLSGVILLVRSFRRHDFAWIAAAHSPRSARKS